MTEEIRLAGARVVAGSRVLDPGHVVVSGDRIAAVGEGTPPGDGPVLDLAGRWLLPGYIDLHVHGGGGGSLRSEEHTSKPVTSSLKVVAPPCCVHY